MNLTEDQILSLAPDESSKKAGRELASPAKWLTRGASEKAIWGECQGSGNKPYQTQIDLANIAFKCSCPSRKFPCKHGVALGLLAARQPALFTETGQPGWVTEWIEKRAEKEEKKTEAKPKQTDPAAQAKRQQSREQKIADGAEELLIWVKDIVRNGIMNIPGKGYQFWDAMAKRMIDAQAPGLSGMIRTIGNINFFKEGWETTFLAALCDLYLVAKGYLNKEVLNAAVLQDVKNYIGFTIGQDELKENQGVSDTWLVVAKQISEEDNLTIERNWMYGPHTNQYALILQFLVRGQGGGALLSPGMHLDAELVYYPSAAPLRALIKRQVSAGAVPPGQLYSGWREVAEKETTVCSLFPVRGNHPYAISKLVPVFYNGGWWLKDQSGNIMSLKENYDGIWKLLALSGGKDLDMVVIGKEQQYEPVGVWHNHTYKVI